MIGAGARADRQHSVCRIPCGLINNRLMLSRVTCTLMGNLAQIQSVVQKLVHSALIQQLPLAAVSFGGDVGFATVACFTGIEGHSSN